MGRTLVVKVEGEDKPYRIPATDVKKEYGKLHVLDGEKTVGEFRLDKLEHWTFTEEEKF
jgi:hypothetical protein